MDEILYECKECNYYTLKKYNYNKHLTTNKHKKMINNYNCNNNINVQSENNINVQSENNKDKIFYIFDKKKFKCICGKSYKHRQSLSLHKKKCTIIHTNDFIKTNDISNNNLQIVKNNSVSTENIKEMFIKLIDENKELQKIIVEQSKQITELIPKIGNTTHNNIKQRFNINMFLNEQCKDALNITEFVESIEISLKQLDLTKTQGLAKGLSNAIIENINKLSIYERPLHCTDIKRETLYVKDANVWEKDREQSKIKKAIKDISVKQFKTLGEWKEKNPDLMYVEEKQDYFSHAISTIASDTSKIDNKIIKNICTNIYIKSDK